MGQEDQRGECGRHGAEEKSHLRIHGDIISDGIRLYRSSYAGQREFVVVERIARQAIMYHHISE